MKLNVLINLVFNIFIYLMTYLTHCYIFILGNILMTKIYGNQFQTNINKTKC